ncbi:MAG: hypothetical protein IPI67_22735 [Myxococcales bacterium]|nr:hypothetical protein [Myxococcales bacterium]
MNGSGRQRLFGAVGVAVALAAIGCGSDDGGGGGGGTGGGAGTGGAAGSGGAAGGGGVAGSGGAAGAGGSVSTTLATVKGTLTLNQANSTDPSADCSTTYEIDGVEDQSALWQCPSCKPTFRSAHKVTTTNCKQPLPPPTLSVGWGSDQKFYWGPGTKPLLELGTATEQSGTVTITVSADFPAPTGSLSVTGTGTLTLGTTQGDPLDGWRPSATYSCGWPQTKPPEYVGKYTPILNDKLPDGVFADACGDKVRLYDLLGRYLVIQANQTVQLTCGPCDGAVAGQKAFEDAMKALNIPTLVVTMLVPDYGRAEFIPTVDDLKAWVDTNQVSGIALADRGFGPAAIGSVLQKVPNFGYPSFLLVAPDGTIVFAQEGFDPTQSVWTQLETEIKTHAGK